MVRRVMKDAFVVWKNSRSIFGLTNYFAGQPRVAGAILSILFGLFLSACGGGSGSSPTVTPPPPLVVIDPITSTLDVTPPPPPLPIFVDAPVQGLHYRPVGSVTLIPPSRETSADGEFDPSYRQLNFGTIAFAVGEITVDGDGLTLSQYKSNGFLGFIVHPAEDWINTESPVVFTPYDLRDADDNTVNVGAVARVLQGFDQTPPSTSPVGFNVDDNLILIHLGATAGRTVIIDRSSPAGQFSVQELDETGTVSTSIVGNEDNYTVVISPTQQYGGATLRFPLHSNAMETLSMVIADMADEISPFSDNSAITLKNGEARTGYFARRGSYSLDSGESDAMINTNTGELTYTPTYGEPPQNVVVTFRYGDDQIIRNQTVELDSLPRTDSENFQIYFTGGKPVALTLKETKGGNLPLRYELDPLSELKRYDLIFDHESGILSGTPQQEAFTVDVALDIFDSGGDDAEPLGPDLEFQIVSREGEPAYYEIDLRGGAGSFATLHFPDRDGNTVSQVTTEKSIAGIDSGCNDARDFGSNCPYSANYIFGGAKHPEGLGDIPGVMVVVGLKSTGGGNTVCAGGTCPAGVKAFTISFQNENDGKPLSVNARVLLPRPAFDPAFASENFATYIAGSPNPSRRPLPAADGGNGRLIYSVTPLTVGLTLHSATRRLLGRPTISVSNNMPDMSVALTMTVRDSNGDGEFASYPFTVVVQPDHIPVFEDASGNIITVAAITLFANLSVSTTFTLFEATNTNRETIYSVSRDIPDMTFYPATRILSGLPREVGSFRTDYIATDLDEHRDENGDLITPVALREVDDDKVTLEIVVFVDGKPSFAEAVPAQSYTVNSPITNLTLSVATGGNGSLTYSLMPLPTGLTFDLNPTVRVLSGTPTGGATVITLTYMVTDDDPDNDPSGNDSAILSITVNIAGDARPMFADAIVDPITLTATWPITQAITLSEVATLGNGATRYEIAPQSLPLPSGLTFNFVNMRGELSGTPADGVGGMIFTITLIASDSDLNFGANDMDDLPFTITVVPDTTPVFSDSVDDQEDYIENSQITSLTLSEATGGNGDLTYSLGPLPLPQGLTFNITTRVLSGTPRLRPTDPRVFQLTYTATDSDPPVGSGDSVVTMFAVSIALDLIPSFTESVPQQNYFEDEEITMTILPAARDGNIPSIYEDALGLPDGIVFNTVSRQLSGTPTDSGSFVATIVAVDTDGTTDESDDDRGVLTFRISVEADTSPSFVRSDVDVQPYTQGVAIPPLFLPLAEGGNEPLRYTVQGLPTDLQFVNSDSKIINGTPTVTGTFDIIYTVEDRNNNLDTFTFPITVSAPLP